MRHVVERGAQDHGDERRAIDPDTQDNSRVAAKRPRADDKDRDRENGGCQANRMNNEVRDDLGAAVTGALRQTDDH